MTVKNYANKRPILGQAVFIDDSAVVIGNVVLGDDVSIWPGVVARGDIHSITIGAGTNVQDGSILHVTHASEYSPNGYALTIGLGVTVGHRAVLHGCSIGDHCLIGIGAIIMDGAVLENEVMIGAGSLVSPGKTLESGYLYVGVPVKKIRPLKAKERDFLFYSEQSYIRLKNEYLKDL